MSARRSGGTSRASLAAARRSGSGADASSGAAPRSRRARRASPPAAQFVLAGAGLLLVSQGLLALVRGDLGWHGYWIGTGLASFAVLLGVLLLLVVILQWQSQRERPAHRRGRAGRPRRARGR